MENLLIVSLVGLRFLNAELIQIRPDRSATIRCKPDTTIQVESATYKPRFQLFCRPTPVTSKIQDLCQGRVLCRVVASDNFCRLNPETLNIYYNCIAERTTISLTTTESLTTDDQTTLDVGIQNDYIQSGTISVVIGCIVGLVALLVIGLVISLLIYRKKRLLAKENHNSAALDMNGVNLENTSDCSRNQSNQLRGYENVAYALSRTESSTISAQRNHKLAHSNIYIDHEVQSGPPPSYDVATNYDTPNNNKKLVHIQNIKDRAQTWIEKSNENTYDTPVKSTETLVSNQETNDHAYENQNVVTSKNKSKVKPQVKERTKVKKGISKRNKNKNQPSGESTKDDSLQVPRTADTLGNNSNELIQGYMPMAFGSCRQISVEDNVYVPIMSPTRPPSKNCENKYHF